MFDCIDNEKFSNGLAATTLVEIASAKQLPARSNFAFKKADLRDMTISCGW